MSCCGGKRNAWNQQVKHVQSSFERMDLPGVEKQKLEQTFEYIGDQSLKVAGASGQVYNFRYKGDRLSVSYYDAFALMAERELKKV